MSSTPSEVVTETKKSRGLQLILGVLVALVVPFLVTGLYRVMPDWPLPIWANLPFVLTAVAGAAVWRFTKWTSIGIGLVTGTFIYAAVLLVILLMWNRGLAIP